MPVLSGVTPAHVTARLIQAYAAQVLVGIDPGGDETPPALFTAALATVNDEETCAIGRAILCRHETLADAGYRYGRQCYPDALAEIAKRLRWEG